MLRFLGRFRPGLPWVVYLLSIICAVVVYACLPAQSLFTTPSQWQLSLPGSIRLDDLIGTTENDSELVVRRSTITGDDILYINTQTGRFNKYSMVDVRSVDSSTGQEGADQWRAFSAAGKWHAVVAREGKEWCIVVHDLLSRQALLRIPIVSLDSTTEHKRQIDVGLNLTASADGKRLSFTLPVDSEYFSYFVWSVEKKQPLTQFLLKRAEGTLVDMPGERWSITKEMLMHNDQDGIALPLPLLAGNFRTNYSWISPDGKSVTCVGYTHQGAKGYETISYLGYELKPGTSHLKCLWEVPLLKDNASLESHYPFGYRAGVNQERQIECSATQLTWLLRHLPTGEKKELGDWSTSLHWPTTVSVSTAGSKATSYRTMPINRLGRVVISDDGNTLLAFRRQTTGLKHCWDWIITKLGQTPDPYADFGYRYHVSLFNMATNGEIAQVLQTSKEPVLAMTRRGDGFAVIETDSIGYTPLMVSSITWYSLPLQPMRINVKPWGYILGAFLTPIFLAMVLKKLQLWRKRRQPVSVPPHP